MAGGYLCISIDLELAWGTWDRPREAQHPQCAELERVIVDRLVELLERHDVAATWAIVGRLLEPDPERRGDAWYAPDVVDRVRRARVEQDIGSHTFAHVYFGELERAQLRADLEVARDLHARHGLGFTSFVFPRNQVEHLDLLREVGIRVFRSVDVGWHITTRSTLGTTAGRVANLVDKVLPVPPSVVQPIDRGFGLVELPSSMLLLARKGLRRAIHPMTTVAKAALGLERARREGGVFHLWFHPSNFYYDTDRQLATLDRILSRATHLRDRGEIAIRPMNTFAHSSIH